MPSGSETARRRQPRPYSATSPRRNPVTSEPSPAPGPHVIRLSRGPAEPRPPDSRHPCAPRMQLRSQPNPGQSRRRRLVAGHPGHGARRSRSLWRTKGSRRSPRAIAGCRPRIWSSARATVAEAASGRASRSGTGRSAHLPRRPEVCRLAHFSARGGGAGRTRWLVDRELPRTPDRGPAQASAIRFAEWIRLSTGPGLARRRTRRPSARVPRGRRCCPARSSAARAR